MNELLFPTPVTVSRKINQLYHLLLKEKNLFEDAASQVTDNALRCSILSIAQQNNQYAAEISAHLQTTRSLSQRKNKKAYSRYAFVDENGLLRFCSSNERKIFAAYTRILQDATLYEGLQKMMHYQLNGIKYACTQLQLLTSVRPRRKRSAKKNS